MGTRMAPAFTAAQRSTIAATSGGVWDPQLAQPRTRCTAAATSEHHDNKILKSRTVDETVDETEEGICNVHKGTRHASPVACVSVSMRKALTLPLAALGTSHWALGTGHREPEYGTQLPVACLGWLLTAAAAALAATRQTPCSGCDGVGDGGGETFVGTNQLASFVHGSRRRCTASQVGREWTAVVGWYMRSPLKPRTRLMPRHCERCLQLRRTPRPCRVVAMSTRRRTRRTL